MMARCVRRLEEDVDKIRAGAIWAEIEVLSHYEEPQAVLDSSFRLHLTAYYATSPISVSIRWRPFCTSYFKALC